MYNNRENLLRWLRALFYIHLASCLLSALTLTSTVFSFSVGSWYTWAQRAFSLGVAVCLILLPGHYPLAGMAKVLGLLCTLLSLYLYPLLNAWGVRLDAASYGEVIHWLSNGSMVLGMIAMVLEYITHAKVTPGDRYKWYILLICSLAVTVISTLLVDFLQPMLDGMSQENLRLFIKLWNGSARFLDLSVSVVYLVLLHRIIHTTEEA